MKTEVLNQIATLQREQPAGSPPVLPYGRQWLDEDDIAAVTEVLRGDWLTQGPAIAEFEKSLAEFCGAKFSVAVSSGTAALHLACLAAGIGVGDFGITSPITFVASANSVAYCGGTPAFADVNPRTATLDVGAQEATAERLRPKVITPVDFAGQPADLPAISRVAKKYGALVIEDAAHSLGASYQHEGQGYRAGSCSHADMAILSFHPVKHITTGEGGAVLTNSEELCRRLLDLRTHGITHDRKRMTRDDGAWYHEQRVLGFNYRITDFQCALGLAQLRKLPAFIERRRELVRLYEELMGDLRDEVTLLTEQPDRCSSYHLLIAQFKGATVRREVFDFMRAQNIRTQVHYIPVHFQPWYRQTYGYAEGDFPNAEAYYAGCLTLPLFPAMNDSDVERVITAVRAALARSRG